MLHIENLTAAIDGNEILRDLNLDIKAGEVHAIMGPNGSGKSTLAHVLGGRDGYDVTGTVTYQGQDLLALSPEERAGAGLFVAFQYPVEIPGVGNLYFLRTALNSIRRQRGLDQIGVTDFLALADKAMESVEMDRSLKNRSVNDGFSGGEKKRNEILQMTMLEPTLAVLDETDSGLDIDAIRIVADGVNALRAPDRSMLVITHYERLLNYIVPDQVHVLAGGRIIRSGGKELATELETSGYTEIVREAAAPVGVDR